jgi:hypothetical protein
MAHALSLKGKEFTIARCRTLSLSNLVSFLHTQSNCDAKNPKKLIK